MSAAKLKHLKIAEVDVIQVIYLVDN